MDYQMYIPVCLGSVISLSPAPAISIARKVSDLLIGCYWVQCTNTIEWDWAAIEGYTDCLDAYWFFNNKDNNKFRKCK